MLPTFSAELKGWSVRGITVSEAGEGGSWSIVAIRGDEIILGQVVGYATGFVFEDHTIPVRGIAAGIGTQPIYQFLDYLPEPEEL